MSESFDCIIIGAGLAGLTSARYLQSAGLNILVIESDDRPGGRVKSDCVDGYTLDHGFQVINRGYPHVKNSRLLDHLNFTPIVEGFLPFRVSGGAKSPSSIASSFLKGVFLTDPNSVPFHVRRAIYKSFLTGKPGFVDGGASAFSNAYAEPISNIHYSESVRKISGDLIDTDHSRYSARNIVIATDPLQAREFIPSLGNITMHSSTTWYHVPSERLQSAGKFTVVQGKNLINSFAISDRVPSYAPIGKQLFSSTALGRVPESNIRAELADIWGVEAGKWELIAHYDIVNSLPEHPKTKKLFSESEISQGLYIAGDHRGFPSQQGAMESGKRAALKIIERELLVR